MEEEIKTNEEEIKIIQGMDDLYKELEEKGLLYCNEFDEVY